jgi:hypothetical protein
VPRGHNLIIVAKEDSMAADKPIKPLPFPGESPTVSLAMAAGEAYGYHEDEKPAAKAKPSRKAGKKSAKPKKAAAKPARKAKSGKAARATKGR